jgi:transcription factor WhiB
VLQAAAVDHRPPCVADPRAWYAEDPETMAEAVRRCQDCPLLTPCGAYADAANEHWGVWAGVPRAATLPPRRPRRPRGTGSR